MIPKDIKKQIGQLLPTLDPLIHQIEDISIMYKKEISEFIIEYIRESMAPENNTVVRLLEYKFLLRKGEIMNFCEGCQNQIAVTYPANLRSKNEAKLWACKHHIFCPNCQEQVNEKGQTESIALKRLYGDDKYDIESTGFNPPKNR